MDFRDLDMLGAEGLGSQYITLRVKAIDKDKLAQALGGAKAAALPAALAVVDFAPRQALDLAMPMVVSKVRDGYGVDLDYQISETAPKAGEAPAKASGSPAKSLLLGAVLGVGGAVAASHYGLAEKAGELFNAARSKVGL